MTKQEEENLKVGDLIFFKNNPLQIYLVLEKKDILEDYWCKEYKLCYLNMLSLVILNHLTTSIIIRDNYIIRK